MSTKSIKILLSAVAVILTIQTATSQSTEKVSESNLERLVATKISMDKNGEFDDRYTIHIYQGDNQGANAAQARYDALGLIWKSELQYKQPDHKVWVGRYRSRLEADRALIEIQKTFPNAKRLKPRVE